MSRPVLFVIDDEAGVVRALRGDLSRRFGGDFRVIGESSAAAGLAVLRELAGRHAPVALLIAGHGMTEMAGVDFLVRGHGMHPLAKRVLLVERDYSARSPVVQAMTLGQADYHLTKPWLLEQVLYREISGFWPIGPRTRRRASSCFTLSGGARTRHARAAGPAHPPQRAVRLPRGRQRAGGPPAGGPGPGRRRAAGGDPP